MEDEQPTREANKICGVCGDRALGYNFNAVSCESCKAFFRRNALKNKDFRCPFTENCSITPVTRRFCQKCRLDKCFSIGMRKEYIMSEADKVLKRQKIEHNRAKKRPKGETTKVFKIKRDCTDDCTFEDTMSVNSVSSTISDTYFWESDKKYTDLDANRQVIDNMSPVTAASVPSPSSPPENGDIGGSKTLDMLKESSSNSSPRVPRYEQTVYKEKEITLERKKSNVENSLQHTMVNDPLSQNTEAEQSTSSFEQNILEMDHSYNSQNNHSSVYNSKFEGNTRHYSNYERDSLENISPTYLEEPINSVPCNLNILPHIENISNDEPQVCQKPKDTCPKNKKMILKFTQNPTLVSKVLGNSYVMTKLFQNQNILLKILTDPDMVSKLTADPHFSQFIQENCAIEDQTISNNSMDKSVDEVVNTVVAAESTNRVNDNLCRTKKTVENPILTGLITSRNTEESKNNYETPSPDCIIINKNMADVTKDVLQEVQRIPIAANSIESILCEAIKLEFSAYSALGGNHSSRELNDAERAKLNELIVANKALLAPLDDDITNLVGDECRFKTNFGNSDPMLLDVINLTAIAIRRLIKMAKKINAFKNMCQDDQLALLKGGCTEMLILRSALNYDPDKDMWKIPHSQERLSKIKVDVLKEAKGNLYAEHAKFVRNFDPRWRDENIILILSAIALFTPDRQRVIHSDVIKLEQNSYYYLLRRYLESVYPGCEAKSTFLKLIQKISELHRLNDEVVGVYLNVNPSSVEPLLIEIFDLKH
ncbi:nuclear hormone receptor HR96 [Prorops nasuta]|uniref:nuclear hormone receptor HR96 n=1 Tax=Prorops nasuta TaxID=863751 RepID=UPI0034CE215D